MNFKSSAMIALADELANLEPEVFARVDDQSSLRVKNLIALAGRPDVPVTYSLQWPSNTDVINDDTITPDDWTAGTKACENGEVAIVYVVNSDIVLSRIPGLDIPYLAHLIAQSRAFNFDGKPIDIPVVVTVPHALERTVKEEACFWAFTGVIPRIVGRPSTLVLNTLGGLLRGPEGRPEEHVTGSGDVGPTLSAAGIFKEFPNVKYFLVTSAHNGMWTPHVGILGQHINAGAKVTTEVMSADESREMLPRIPCWFNGTLRVIQSNILEESDMAGIPFECLDSYVINREVLMKDIDWEWVRNRIHAGRVVGNVWCRWISQLTSEFATRMVYVDHETRCHIVKNIYNLAALGVMLHNAKTR